MDDLVSRSTAFLMSMDVIKDVEDESKSNEDCCVCLEPLSSDAFYAFCVCEHMMHAQCIYQVFMIQRKKYCPLCRADTFKLANERMAL